MEFESQVFEGIYRDYLAQLAGRWQNLALAELGLERAGKAVVAPFYGQALRVSPEGVVDPVGNKPNHARCVVLLKYLLARPPAGLDPGPWTAYREFKDAAPFAAGFDQSSQRLLAQAFSGRLGELARAGASLGGKKPAEKLSYDLSLTFSALPRVDLLLLFNDEEDGFPAACSLLFQHRAPAFLDMECLAILGMVLAEALVKAGH